MASVSRVARVVSRMTGMRTTTLNAKASRTWSNAGRGFTTLVGGGSRGWWRNAGVLVGGAMITYSGFGLICGEEGVSFLSAATAKEQPSVCGENKTHSLFLWIHLKPDANVKECAKVAATLKSKVKLVTGPTPDDEDEILAGVGFGPSFYGRVTGGKSLTENYTYPHRKGYNGAMPSTGGDIFVHAKSSSYSKLYELCQLVVRSFPLGAVESAEDIYGWTYQEGRDLSGFIDGTENPAEEEERVGVAVDGSGGSYAITQKWIHKMDVIQSTKDKVLEGYLGRTKADSIEINKKVPTAHVARMVGTSIAGQPKPYQMVRHSQPFGTVCGQSGLFFIGYAASPANFEYMLDRMTGCDKDGLCDDVMKLSECVAGTYWYFPSEEQLNKMT